MPGYKGHLVGGVAAYVVLLYVLQNQCSSSTTAVQWLGCTLMGALFPDIDVKSKGQKYFYWILLGALLILLISEKYELLAVCGIASTIPMLSKHRGMFHEPWFVIALPAAAWLGASAMYPQHAQIFFFYAFFFAIGALSHLYLDRGFRGLIPKKKFKKY